MTKQPYTPTSPALPAELAGRTRPVWHTDLNGPFRSADEFAEAAGCEVARVAKTIFAVAGTPPEDGDGPCALIVLSSPSRVDLAAVSRHLSAPSMRLAKAAEVEARLGMRPGAVSPFLADRVPVLIDAALHRFETVYVSGGQPGLDLEIDPRDLVELANGCVGAFASAV